MVENDAVNVSAYVRIYKDPTGVLWHNLIKLVLVSSAPKRLTNYMKLQLQKGDRHGWHEESRSNLLSEFSLAIAVFYKCVQKGTGKCLKSNIIAELS